MTFIPLIEFIDLDGSRRVVVQSEESSDIEILPMESLEQTAAATDAEQEELLRKTKPPTDSTH